MVARLHRAEQQIRLQDAQIKTLQARLDMIDQPAPISTPLAPLRIGGLDRSRSPRGGLKGRGLGAAANDTLSSVLDFISASSLDEKCIEVLKNQPPEVQKYVVSLGPPEGRNPSAMVMGRITRGLQELNATVMPVPTHAPHYFPDDVEVKVEDFIAQNSLDEKCAEALRTQTTEVQVRVLQQGPAAGRNSSAMVMGRIRQALRE